ncbi:L-carnitine dehydratase/bile acid-inducible protein F [Aminomonas paucivorans DSM 12260]|uniref:L-carnitine dehydratase/bile acid-inducible protein F n=1 Tax=Aminomonas paucivorans DSM 12260 TaxID=584708 RepID=E3CZZ6_9BACT|nr:CoA transferase [Aminomonas paucivorans]EFQ22928.1 L-carnitine dehydratase/bile acid-inducible protein F [Aminomonas paucivorans DSM 12260]
MSTEKQGVGSGPLEGVLVLDLSRALAGPYCTMVLGDLGATVLKAEVPGRGDDSRGYLPLEDGQSGYFATFNRNKRSFTLNLRAPEGQDLCRRLARRADVLVENFSPGTMEGWGLGHEALREENPRLVYCSISGFGQTGPESSKLAFDITAQARGGLMGLTGFPDAPPTRVGSSLGDIATGMFAANAVCAALYRRSVTGRGDRLDLAMVDSVFAILENALVRAQLEPLPPGRMGSAHASAAPYDVYPTADGWLVLGCATRPTWERLCAVMERPDLADHPLFATNEARIAHLVELTETLSAWTRTLPTDEAVALLEASQVPAAPVRGVAELLGDKQLAARDMLVPSSLPGGREVLLPGCPMHFAENPSGIRLAPPLLGEHNDLVHRELLGLSEGEIETLKGKGIL